MSDDAIYSVTQALRQLLFSQLSATHPNAQVSISPPGELPSHPDGTEPLGVNLYLYRVLESPFTRNRPWPGDRSTRPSDQPALGLELFYLLTPLGTRPQGNDLANGDFAHQMLGAAMLTLHQYPVLNNVHIPGFDADVVLSQSLRDSYEQIKVCLAPVSLEEMSRIWATINQPYRLSVAYDVSLVELTPSPVGPVGGGIVRQTDVAVVTLDPPRLTALNPSAGPLAAIDANGNVTAKQVQINGIGLIFAGEGLPGKTRILQGEPIVHCGGKAVTVTLPPAPLPPNPPLTMTLPLDLDAGPQVDVRVTTNGRTSLPLPFTINPWLSGVRPLRTALDAGNTDPQTGEQLDMTLTLEGSGLAAAQTVRFEGPLAYPPVPNPPPALQPVPFSQKISDTQATVTIPTGLGNGVYNVRVVLPDSGVSNARTIEVIPFLDGAQSTLVVNAPAGTTQATIRGKRLTGMVPRPAGASPLDARLVVDGQVYQVTPLPTDPTQWNVTISRALDAGLHRVYVIVDGQTSRTVSLAV
ncbi:MAG TPA: DUF4255 domain-containing protein [Chloroflexota bacterium]|nr:DUF4255 domain-containing protein [Chloroflexota bacterium]